MIHDRIRKHRPDHLRVFDEAVGQISGREIGIAEVAPHECRAMHLCSAQHGSFGLAFPKRGPRHRAAGKVCPCEPAVDECALIEIAAGKAHPREVALHQRRLMQRHAGGAGARHLAFLEERLRELRTFEADATKNHLDKHRLRAGDLRQIAVRQIHLSEHDAVERLLGGDPGYRLLPGEGRHRDVGGGIQ